MTNLTNDEIREILANEYRDMREMCTNRVVISRLPVGEGVLVLFKITVNAKTYYLSAREDTTPKETNQIVFYIRVNNGYPRVKPDVFFEDGKRLAGVNTFVTGAECIDEWHFDEEHAANNSTLAGTMRKTIMDIIHVEAVTRYDSMANRALEEWQRSMTKKGLLPSCNPAEIFRGQGTASSIPARRGSVGLPSSQAIPVSVKRTIVPLPRSNGGAR